MEWAGAVIRKIQGDKPPYNDLSVMTSSQDTEPNTVGSEIPNNHRLDVQTTG